MATHQATQLSQSLSVEPSALPNIAQSNQLPIDPTNPLAWILVLTLLLSRTDEVINAVANLIRTLKRKDDTQQDNDNSND